ncbi:hypothetical protein A6L66_00045 [Neisseria meningitidis]|nr:hypothetical protein A6L66_00045 [Neisseria meningitidis]
MKFKRMAAAFVMSAFFISYANAENDQTYISGSWFGCLDLFQEVVRFLIILMVSPLERFFMVEI